MTKAAELAKMGEVLTNSQIGGRRNIVINGAMQVAQRGTSSTSTGYGSVDRIRVNTNNLDQLAFTQSQSTTTPGQGFSNSFKFEVTTKEDALSGGEFANIQYRIEAQDLQSLAYGTSDAKKATLSFWVRSSLTGKYSVLFYQADDVRSNTQSFTISSADTWEHKTITIDGDTTGVIDNNNGLGININFQLAAGGDYAGTPHSGWGAYAETDDFAFDDQVNFIAQTGTFYLTGLQFEIGEQATPFEHRSFGEELALCQRYYYKSMDGSPADNIPNTDNTSSNGHLGIAMYSTTSGRLPYFKHPVQMRADPSVTVYSSERANTSGKFALFNQSSWVATATSTPVVDINRASFSVTVSSGLTAGSTYLLAGGFDADAEL